VHGQQAVAAAEAASAALIGRGDLADVDERTLADALTTVPHAVADVASGPVTVADLLVATGLTPSKGAARRAASDGGVYVNNERLVDADAQVEVGRLLHGRWLVLRRGRRTVAGVDMGGPQA
jgi:tyrosyl-tRNA synthetase